MPFIVYDECLPIAYPKTSFKESILISKINFYKVYHID